MIWKSVRVALAYAVPFLVCLYGPRTSGRLLRPGETSRGRTVPAG